jgi:hypothetical protein
LQKAYDSVPTAELWAALDQINRNQATMVAIPNLYNGSKSTVKVGNKLTKELEVNKGLREDRCISPTLFKIYVAEGLKRWKRKCRGMGIELSENTNLCTLPFADDRVPCA